MIHSYGNPYEKWNIFVAWPHLWLKLGMVKPEIMLCLLIKQSDSGAHVFVHALKLKADTLNIYCASNVFC